jgi:hypothetical protein
MGLLRNDPQGCEKTRHGVNLLAWFLRFLAKIPEARADRRELGSFWSMQ